MRGLTPPVERSSPCRRHISPARRQLGPLFHQGSEAFGAADVGISRLHLDAMPNRHRLQVGVIDIGRDDHAARATSSITSDSGRFSRLAHEAISSVTTPDGRNASATTLASPRRLFSIQALRMDRLEKGAFDGGRWVGEGTTPDPDATGADRPAGCIRDTFPAPA